MQSRKHLLIKILLIFVAEAVAMSATLGISTFIYHIHHPLIVHIIGGALLAILVVWLYNRAMLRKKRKVEKELKEITKVVLKEIPEDKDDTNRK